MDEMEVIKGFMKQEQEDKVKKYRVLNERAKKGGILFTGSSLMEQFPMNELLMTNGINKLIYNRGIGGFTTSDMLSHMEETVFGTEPSKIFINIGTNDMSDPDYKLETLMYHYEKILCQIKDRLPETMVYVMAYYPVNETDKKPQGEWGKHLFDFRNNKNIRIANQAAKRLANRMEYQYIDVNAGLTDERGMLKKEYTLEGIHLFANAYQIILENLTPYLV